MVLAMALREELLQRHFPGDHARLDVVLKVFSAQDIDCVRELEGAPFTCFCLWLTSVVLVQA